MQQHHQLVTLLVLGGVFVGLFQERIGAELVMLAALTVLILFGVVDSNEALAGFANPSVVAIASLFVVGAGLRTTGAVEHLGRWLLGRPKPNTNLMRLTAPIAALSAFMNNTPLVASFLPIFVQFAKRLRISPSRLLIPLSYASILGGACTLIGTSTNLVVDGIIREQKMPGLSMFELTWVGLPVTVLGLVYLATIGRRLLPDREDLLERIETHRREYTLEMVVRNDCPLVNQSVRKAGLRDLPGLYLFRIERPGRVITPVSGEERILAGDLLSFSGIVSTVVDLQKIRGLDPVDHLAAESGQWGSDGSDSLDSLEGVPATEPSKAAPRTGRRLCEAVISPFSPLEGQTIRDVGFRARYNASVVAVHRSSEKIEQKIGQIVLQSGDTLLIDADEDFARLWRNSRDFILVSSIDDSAPIAHERTWVALVIFLGVIAGMSIFPAHAAVASMCGALLMALTGCVPPREVHRSIELPVLLLIGASLGVGRAMETSGAAEFLASGLLAACQGYGKIVVLGAFVVLTGIFTELLSNNATAALMGSLAVATANQMGMDPRPLLVAVAVSASYGFATPIGYQTNLMVLNAGGYRFIDYFKVGIPLDIIAWVTTILIIPLVWPL